MRKHAYFIRLLIAAAVAYATWKVFDWNLSSGNVVTKVKGRDTIAQPDNRMKQQVQPPPQYPEKQIKLMQQKQQAVQTPPTQPTQQSTQQTQPQKQSPTTSLISSAPTASTSVKVKPTKKAASAFNASTRIPRILHQAFKSEMVYENYLPYINGCLALNPDWTYYLWRDSDAKALIASAYPEFLSKYNKYSDVLERADSIRYIVLHHFGGIYLDMDVECVKPFFPALADLNSFLDQERIEQTNIHWNWPFSVMNSAMGSAPGHPFFRQVIDEMLHQSQVGSAFTTTGPTMLTRVYKRYTAAKTAVPVNLLEPNIMSPLMDVGKNWKHMCGSMAAAKSKPESNRSWKDRGCIKLESKNWRLDDTDNSTICIHRFLHLGYGFAAGARKKPFNVTARFWPRVRTFNSSDLLVL